LHTPCVPCIIHDLSQSSLGDILLPFFAKFVLAFTNTHGGETAGFRKGGKARGKGDFGKAPRVSAMARVRSKPYPIGHPSRTSRS